MIRSEEENAKFFADPVADVAGPHVAAPPPDAVAAAAAAGGADAAAGAA